MADEDIKQQADMQREKSAPQPREKESPETSVLEEINAKLGIQVNIARNDVSIQAQILRTNTAGFMALSESFSKLSAGMVEKSSLKDLENQKEASARAEETNKLLKGIFGRLQDSKVGKISSGFFSILIGSVAAIVGTIAGVSAGFITGFFERIFFSIDKNGKRVLRSPFRGFLNIIEDIGKAFKNRILKSRFIMNAGFLFDDILASIKELRVNARSKIGLIGQRIILFFDNIVDSVRGALKSLRSTSFISKSGGIAKAIGAAFTFLGAGVFNFLMEIPRGIFKLVADLTEPLQKIVEAFIGKKPKNTQMSLLKGMPAKAAGAVKGVAKTFATILNPFFTILKTTSKAFFAFGKTLGRFFLPLTIIFGIVDTIRGVIGGIRDTAEGESKLVSALFGGVKGLLVGFIGIPLDLLKSGISFLTEKILGEGNIISTFLDNNDFSDLIRNVIDGIEFVFQNVGKVFTAIVDAILNPIDTFNSFIDSIATFGSNIFDSIGNALTSVKNKVKEFIQTILRKFLPDPTASLLTPQGVAASLIPDRVYEFAGLDPSTGELTGPINPNQQIIDDRELQLAAKNMGGGNTQNQIITDASNKAVQNISIVNDTTPKETGAALTDNFG